MQVSLVQCDVAKYDRSGMTYEQLLAYFKTVRKITEVLRVTHQAVYLWKRTGKVPIKQAARASEASQGRLKIDPTVYA